MVVPVKLQPVAVTAVPIVTVRPYDFIAINGGAIRVMDDPNNDNGSTTYDLAYISNLSFSFLGNDWLSNPSTATAIDGDVSGSDYLALFRYDTVSGSCDPAAIYGWFPILIPSVIQSDGSASLTGTAQVGSAMSVSGVGADGAQMDTYGIDVFGNYVMVVFGDVDSGFQYPHLYQRSGASLNYVASNHDTDIGNFETLGGFCIDRTNHNFYFKTSATSGAVTRRAFAGGSSTVFVNDGQGFHGPIINNTAGNVWVVSAPNSGDNPIAITRYSSAGAVIKQTNVDLGDGILPGKDFASRNSKMYVDGTYIILTNTSTGSGVRTYQIPLSTADDPFDASGSRAFAPAELGLTPIFNRSRTLHYLPPKSEGTTGSSSPFYVNSINSTSVFGSTGTGDGQNFTIGTVARFNNQLVGVAWNYQPNFAFPGWWYDGINDYSWGFITYTNGLASPPDFNAYSITRFSYPADVADHLHYTGDTLEFSGGSSNYAVIFTGETGTNNGSFSPQSAGVIGGYAAGIIQMDILLADTYALQTYVAVTGNGAVTVRLTAFDSFAGIIHQETGTDHQLLSWSGVIPAGGYVTVTMTDAGAGDLTSGGHPASALNRASTYFDIQSTAHHSNWRSPNRYVVGDGNYLFVEQSIFSSSTSIGVYTGSFSLVGLVPVSPSQMVAAGNYCYYTTLGASPTVRYIDGPTATDHAGWSSGSLTAGAVGVRSSDGHVFVFVMDRAHFGYIEEWTQAFGSHVTNHKFPATSLGTSGTPLAVGDFLFTDAVGADLSGTRRWVQQAMRNVLFAAADGGSGPAIG